MGVASVLLNILFGDGRNLVAETAEVFRPNAEASESRDAAFRAAALAQFSAEFAVPRKGGFDRFMDGLNRVPRPAMALGTLALLGSAMTNPDWFAARMQGIALVPEPLWWLTGAIVSFYFGARHQVKGQEFQRSIAETMARLPEVEAKIAAIEPKDAAEVQRQEPPVTRRAKSNNAALDAWRASHAGR